jgi:ribosomal protein L28
LPSNCKNIFNPNLILNKINNKNALLRKKVFKSANVIRKIANELGTQKRNASRRLSVIADHAL